MGLFGKIFKGAAGLVKKGIDRIKQNKRNRKLANSVRSGEYQQSQQSSNAKGGLMGKIQNVFKTRPIISVGVIGLIGFGIYSIFNRNGGRRRRY